MSFLRKQESSVIAPEAGTQGTWTSRCFWIPAFAGMTPFIRLPLPFSGLPRARGEASCFIRPKGYMRSFFGWLEVRGRTWQDNKIKCVLSVLSPPEITPPKFPPFEVPGTSS